MKSYKNNLILMAALLVSNTASAAVVTYDYVGALFDSVYGSPANLADFGDHITMSITFEDTHPSGAVAFFNGSGNLINFSISDGITTITGDNSNAGAYYFNYDFNYWYFNTSASAGEHKLHTAFNSVLAYGEHNDASTFIDSSYVVTGKYKNDALASDPSLFTKTGTWTKRATAVPEPEVYAMMLAGLGLVGFAARKKGEYLKNSV